MFPEIRIDILSGRQVIMAPLRSRRPHSAVQTAELTSTDDPFAAGHEVETPAERLALRGVNSIADQPGWQVRVVPNRYPAVHEQLPDTAADTAADMAADMAAKSESDNVSPWLPSRPAFGQHDVVIECPDSRSRLTELSPTEIAAVLRAWQLRLRQLRALPQIRQAAVFRNQGAAAGASLTHAHSQIIATAATMPQIAERHRRATEHRSLTGRDLVQDWLEAERCDSRRIVRETDAMVCLCPFASRSAYQLRLVALSQQIPRFEELDSSFLTTLAAELRVAADALEKCLGTTAGNLILLLPPFQQEASFRWMIDLLPRTSQAAGWEYLTDTEIVTTLPEDAAMQLRAVICTDLSALRVSDTGPPSQTRLEWRVGNAPGNS